MRAPPRVLVLLLAVALLGALAACAGQPDRSASQPPAVGVHDIDAKDVQFTPAAVQVKRGTTVVWHLEDKAVSHDVRGDGFSSPVQEQGTFSHRFDRTGTFSYRCSLHAGMIGRVVVTD
jgi:plastocyanin